MQDVFVLNWFQFASSMTVRIWIWLGGGVFEVGGRGCEVDPDTLVHNMLYEYHKKHRFDVDATSIWARKTFILKSYQNHSKNHIRE